MENNDYNAKVTGKILLTPDLMILRVKTDEHRNIFEAGQYTTLGINSNEPRSHNSLEEFKISEPNKMIRRAYSIASANHDTDNFEFYVSQVKSGQLTPRLFNLYLGDKLWVGNKILGVFKLSDTPPQTDIVMIATGTGLAPYISFLRSHIKDHQDIKLVVIHGAAYPWDLGYFSELEFIKNTFSNFYYYPTLLAGDETWSGLRGRIETHLENKLLENEVGIEMNPDKTHFFLCGSPSMVETISSYLEKFNYTKHTNKNPGSMHVEEW
jgi:ferredoxin--NADP+ reductase